MLSDVEMPRLDGRGLVRRLEACYPGLPVVLMSGNPEIDVSDVCCHFIAKPFTPAAMGRLLDEVRAANLRSAVI